jgi:hypothetical protein
MMGVYNDVIILIRDFDYRSVALNTPVLWRITLHIDVDLSQVGRSNTLEEVHRV